MIPTRQNKIIRSVIAETGVIPDNLQLLRDSYHFKVIDAPILSESKNSPDQPVMKIKGLFQEGNIINSNGRRYDTKTVLAPAVQDIQEDVDRRAVQGEYDHPCLCDSDFRVLTVDGWKEFTEINVGDTVYSRVNGQMVESRVNSVINEPYAGKAYKVKGRYIDSTFSPGHRFLMSGRCDKPQTGDTYATVKEIYSNRAKYNKNRIPRTAEWYGDNIQTFTIPGIKNLTISPNRFKNDVTEDLVLDARLFVSFLGIYLAEGSVQQSNYGIYIHQFKDEGCSKISKLLDKFPENLKWSKVPNGFYLADARLHKYLSNLGDKYSKFIPDEIKRLDAPLLQDLVRWFQVGDGRSTNGRNNVFTVSYRLIRDLHECHVKSGGCCYFTKIESKKDYEFAGRTIRASAKQPLFQLTLSETSGIYLDDRFCNIEEVDHDGSIYCLSVDHGNFYMEQNGRSFWTGNSDAKIHLDRISHLITNVWMDGNKVYGEAEVLHKLPLGAALRGLFEHRVQTGISSRGVGDMELTEDNHRGKFYRVCPGYTILTWDVVADPSVKNAVLQISESVQNAFTNPRTKKLFSRDLYQKALLEEINRFFNVSKGPTTVSMSGTKKKK